MYCGYILRSIKTHRFYAGHTQDLQNRLIEHNAGETASIRHGIPWELIHSEEFSTRTEAMKWEKRVKARGIERYLRVIKDMNLG